MPGLKQLLKISRPRFWIYTLGPYLVGIAAAGVDVAGSQVALLIVFAIYFLLPANLLIYGVNDIFDADTDLLNEKKSGYEDRLDVRARNSLIIFIAALNLPFVVLAAASGASVMILLAAFLFLSIFYSAPPIRAKSKPVLDSAFNVLYVFPGLISFAIVTGQFAPPDVVVAGAAWTAAMHAYSAVPDISADRSARIATIATFLGDRATLVVCALLFCAAALLAFKSLSYLAVLLVLVYLMLVVISFRAMASNKLFAVYRVFPIVNAACGFAIFWYLVLRGR
jgi:4-hydroxybenzoate polyprenyltransferase